MTNKKVLIIGNGGREHAICWKLSQSEYVSEIFALPGSYGIEQVNKVKNLTGINPNNFKEVAEWCTSQSIDLVVVGPEDPLANGIADELRKVGVRCFGPGKQGAQIESDKKWAKDFMIRHKIPTARYESFQDVELAKDFVRRAQYNAMVVKASGLAAGKGVVVANNLKEACNAIDEILGKKKYGKAGDVVVIEDKLTGEEVSVLAFVDSSTVKLMLPSQDHKRLKENDQGPNTGGMGAYCPCPLISKADLEFVRTEVLQKAVDGLKQEGIQYCGVLYAGLMLTPEGPRVLEFNCRFGDPETQVILPLLESDLYEVMEACCNNKLNSVDIKWKENQCAVGVVMASAGYPETSEKGTLIEGIPSNTESRIIFHSGVTIDESGKFRTNGGRVLIAVCLGKDLKLAAAEATKVCLGIKFYGGGAQFRNDIAQKAFKFERDVSLSYKDSGVDIDAGDLLVQRIKPLARGTRRPGVLGGIGGFGGLLSLNELNYKNPVLCEVTNGVGSKVELALDCEMYDMIGYDLVAMCVNDVLESGAEPVAFLDYIACGKLEVPKAAQIIKGMSEACREANCAILGGETAEMPSVYAKEKYDMAGYCLGVLEDGFDLPKFDKYEEGDLVIGLPSSGFHCSNFSYIFELCQKVGHNLHKLSDFGDLTKTFGQIILQPTRMYAKNLLPLVFKRSVKSIAHVTSGLKKGIEKIVPEKFEVSINAEKFSMTELYGWLAANGELTDDALFENFNCGIGMVFVVSKNNTDWKEISETRILGELKKQTHPCKKVSVINMTTTVENVANKFYRGRKVNRTKQLNVTDYDHYRKLVWDMMQVTHQKNSITAQNGKQLLRVPKTFQDPILVIGTDGVGTKIKIAQECKINSTVGIDLVAMCANDILCNGAEPLTFLSYYACGQLEEKELVDVVTGVVKGATQAESNLMDCQISEVPLLYKKNVYDLAGFALGITERDTILPRSNEICEGDILIALPSSGVHSNGFSLVHKVLEYAGLTFSDKSPFSNRTLGEEFLIPTKIYVQAIKPLLKQKCIKALAHITGGGLVENIPRVLPKHLGVHIDAKQFNIPPVFAWLAEIGNIRSYEMERTYNCGIGLVLVVDPVYESLIMQHLKFAHRATKIGTVVQLKSLNTPQVVVDHFEECITRVQKLNKLPKKRVAVLISGNGSNLQALIDATRNSTLGIRAEIVLVISNKADAYGLTRARNADIPAIFISHKDYSSREEFDNEITRKMEEYKVDLVCLAGFMRVLSNKFVKRWKSKLINIHPSLLPKHPGLDVQKKAIEAGDSESGCTVHFVDEGIDTGAIIVQESVPILPNDTVESLTNRIHTAEHCAFPKALKLIANGHVWLDENGKSVYVE